MCYFNLSQGMEIWENCNLSWRNVYEPILPLHVHEIFHLLTICDSNQKYEVNETDPSGFSPLHYAARAGNASIVQELLQAGASPDTQTKGQQVCT
jgi:ankyrin repeat protein